MQQIQISRIRQTIYSHYYYYDHYYDDDEYYGVFFVRLQSLLHILLSFVCIRFLFLFTMIIIMVKVSDPSGHLRSNIMMYMILSPDTTL